MNNELVKELTEAMLEMQEMFTDKEASPEMKSNARSYIRGMKKAVEIIQKHISMRVTL